MHATIPPQALRVCAAAAQSPSSLFRVHSYSARHGGRWHSGTGGMTAAAAAFSESRRLAGAGSGSGSGLGRGRRWQYSVVGLSLQVPRANVAAVIWPGQRPGARHESQLGPLAPGRPGPEAAVEIVIAECRLAGGSCGNCHRRMTFCDDNLMISTAASGPGRARGPSCDGARHSNFNKLVLVVSNPGGTGGPSLLGRGPTVAPSHWQSDWARASDAKAVTDTNSDQDTEYFPQFSPVRQAGKFGPGPGVNCYLQVLSWSRCSIHPEFAAGPGPAAGVGPGRTLASCRVYRDEGQIYPGDLIKIVAVRRHKRCNGLATQK